jgi:hypothetical protein
MPSANCELSSPPNKCAAQWEKFLPDRNRRDSHESDQRRFLPGSLTVKGRILQRRLGQFFSLVEVVIRYL